MVRSRIQLAWNKIDFGSTYMDCKGLATIIKQQVINQQNVMNNNIAPNNNNQTEKMVEINGKILEQFKRLGPSSFQRGPYPVIAEQWIMQIEKLFKIIRPTSSKRSIQ